MCHAFAADNASLTTLPPDLPPTAHGYIFVSIVRTRSATTLIGLLLFLGTVALYASAFWNGFVGFDDDDYVSQNKQVLTGVNLDNMRWALTTHDAANWHPLTWISLQLDSDLYRSLVPSWPAPRGYIVTNMLLHAASTWLLFMTLLWMTGYRWRSALVAACFAVHPLHVESVAWIAERKDVLSGFFWMLTLLAYAHYVRQPSVMRYLLVLLAFALGLASKPMVVTLPFVLLLLDYWPLGRLRRSRLPSETWNASGGPNSGQEFQKHLTPVLGGEALRVRGPKLPRRTPSPPSPLPGVPGRGEKSATASERQSGAAPVMPRPADGTYMAIVEKVPLLAMAAAGCVFTWYAQHRGQAVADMTWFPLNTRLANAALSYWMYLGKTIWPTNLAAFYPHPRDTFSAWQVGAAAAGLVAVTLAAMALRKRCPYVSVGWFWYLGTLVPAIGLVQVGGQGMADRYTYLPLIGIFVLVVWSGADAAPSLHLQKPAGVVAGLFLLIWSLYAWAQIHVWQDGPTLWKHALQVTTNNARAHTNLGRALMQQDKLPEAIDQFKEAMRIDPTETVAGINLGAVYLHQGNAPAAIESLSDLLERYPEVSQAHVNLGTAYEMIGKLDEAIHHYAEAARFGANSGVSRKWGAALERRGDLDEAIAHYREALDLDPSDAMAWLYLGNALARQKKWQPAADSARRATELDPQNGRAHRILAHALFQLGEKDAARQEYQQALRIEPKWPEAANAKAWVQATHLEPAKRDGRNALELAEQACEATAEREPRFLDTLAAAYAETGEFDRAVAIAARAEALASSAQQAGLAQAVRERLRKYQQKQAFRSSNPAPNS